MAYEYGSQSELYPPPKTASTATFKLLGPPPANQTQDLNSRLSSLDGVVSATWSSRSGVAKVDYDTSAITTKEIAQELQNLGFTAESVVRIRVEGMHCQSCVQSIEGQIGPLPGVSHIQVSLEGGAALIAYRPLVVTQQELADRIQDMGFAATLFPDDPPEPDSSCWPDSDSSIHTVSIWIQGMTCNSCVQSIEGRISQMSGVQSIKVSLKEEKGTVTFDPSLTEPEQLRAAIEDMGFDASLDGRHPKQDVTPAKIKRMNQIQRH